MAEKVKRRNIAGEDPRAVFSQADEERLTIPIITPEGVMRQAKPEFMKAIEALRRANLRAKKARKSIHPVS